MVRSPKPCSELFGHERGSFTGAVGKRELFEMANGGTLFLDELGETSLNVQVNLLRVLEEMRFRRVGGRESISVDVRITATNVGSKPQSLRNGSVKTCIIDSTYTLFSFHLCERPEDIPLLIRHFLEAISAEYKLDVPVVASMPRAHHAILMAGKCPPIACNVRTLGHYSRWQRVEREHLPLELGGMK